MAVKNLRITRERLGLSQAEVAEALGVKLMRYRAWEQGQRNPTMESLCALADYFDCSLDWLLGRPVPKDFEDPREAALHATWTSLDPAKRKLIDDLVAALNTDSE